MKRLNFIFLMGVFSLVCSQSIFATEFNSVEFGLNNRSKHLQNISFVPGVGTNVVAVAHLACIWHSSDNGANWRQVRGPVHANPAAEADIPINDSILYGVGFISDQIGFACGGTEDIVSILFNTSDGGLTWTDVSSQLPADVRTRGLTGICPVDETTAYIYGCKGVVIKASKSGSVWSYTKKVSIGTDANDAKGMDFAGTTAFATDQLGLLLRNAAIDDSQSPWTLATITPSSPGWGKWLILDVEFFDANNGLTVGNQGKILKTTDGGATWALVTSGVPNNLSKIAYVSSQRVFVSGRDGTILESTDGGTTWTSATSNTVRAINSIDAKNGQVLAVCFHGTVLSNPAQVPNALNSVKSAEVAVYPNPAIDYLQIECDKTISGIRVSDITGKSVLSGSDYSGSLYVGNLSTGIYFVTIQTKEGEIRQKFFKK
jgi:photosystem II stability/assembly factor-like uncharacterized protein